MEGVNGIQNEDEYNLMSPKLDLGKVFLPSSDQDDGRSPRLEI